jgi:beta-xylosidase
MTTATNIAGPWSPLAHVLKAKGWDDCCPFWDGDGQGYLIGSQFDQDPVNGRKYNIHLWKLTADGKALVKESDAILHQSNGSEANKLYKWNGLYYHYFSEVRAEGRVPMMGRATNIAGPYEYRQIGHVRMGLDGEPNQGGIVQSEAGDWWFFTHHGSGDWSGRIASLLPVTWTNGWPIIGEVGADGIGNMVWSARKPVKASPHLTPQTDDEFSGPTLSPQWEWHYQPRAGKWSLSDRPGFLRLHAFRPLRGDDLLRVGNVLTQRSWRTATNVVTVKMEVDGMADAQSAGLFQYSTAGYAGVGVTQTNGRRCLIYRSGAKMVLGPQVNGTSVWLRATWGLDGVSNFSRSLDGKTFEPVGEPYQMKWSTYRGDRVGLFTCNQQADAGYVDFDSVHYGFSGQADAAVSRAGGNEVLLFTYFRNNGADGVHLAMTTNGVDFFALNGDKPIFKPPQWPGQNLTRDASVLYHDGKFRMVWTSAWKGRVFGYTESDDLVHWSAPCQMKPFPESLPGEDQPDNVWAPEIHFDPLKQDYFILFSSTTPRERNDGDDSNNNGLRGSQYDNRVFITRTKDFQTWSAAKVFFDRDFASIDAVMRRDEANQRWVMVIKCSRDETLATMPGRNLWLTFTGLDLDNLNFSPLEGPIAGNHSRMFSNPAPRKAMAEGPSLLWVDNHWLLAWDEPAGSGVQLATSPDLKTWTHLKQATFPHPAQHGTLFLAPRGAVGWLIQTNLY